MGRRKHIDAAYEEGILTIRTAPAFQPLLAPARYKGSGSTKARDVPPPMPRIVRAGGRQAPARAGVASLDGPTASTSNHCNANRIASLSSGIRTGTGNRTNNCPRVTGSSASPSSAASAPPHSSPPSPRRGRPPLLGFVTGRGFVTGFVTTRHTPMPQPN
jgi:hypothetical protein